MLKFQKLEYFFTKDQKIMVIENNCLEKLNYLKKNGTLLTVYKKFLINEYFVFKII